ncbi:MAG: TRAP transporter large permease subunit [Bacteroidia bacterium]|nr:TRAP transporter large permease subunit [Bacteroidia bacterium]
MGLLALILFIVVFALILWGFPVAFTLGGISAIFGLIFLGPDYFSFLPSRIMGTMSNPVLIAVPLFIYMGIMLEKSGLAARMLETMAMLFGRLRGGLAVSVVIVGALLAASTGIVGATVITMGLISLPTMIKRGYDVPLATGTIAASGTLGQIIPPSIVLVLLGSVLSVSVGDLFKAAFIPGFLLVAAYIIYILIKASVHPETAPAIPQEEIKAFRDKGFVKRALMAFLLPLLLIIAVLGSIFKGIASPTEAAAVGALGATILTIIQGEFKLTVLKDVMKETTHLTSMVFMILLGATTFALVFRGMEGDDYLISLLLDRWQLSQVGFLIIVMIIVFIAGFFIDFIEIIFIIVPVVAPIFQSYGMDLIWIGTLLALNLQTSFLTPPFGFSLFYLKGVAPPQVKTTDIYKGIIPFLIIQVIFLVTTALYPDYIYLLIK